jgi:8-oxo-dGTP diphosphatase
MNVTGKIRVVAAVIQREGRYLLCERPSSKRHGGLWAFPGGKLEPGEGILEAVTRELKEELGVEVLAVGEQWFVRDDPDSTFVIEFHATSILGVPVCLEHAALEWVTPRQMLAMALAPTDRLFAQFLFETFSKPI